MLGEGEPRRRALTPVTTAVDGGGSSGRLPLHRQAVAHDASASAATRRAQAAPSCPPGVDAAAVAAAAAAAAATLPSRWHRLWSAAASPWGSPRRWLTRRWRASASTAEPRVASRRLALGPPPSSPLPQSILTPLSGPRVLPSRPVRPPPLLSLSAAAPPSSPSRTEAGYDGGEPVDGAAAVPPPTPVVPAVAGANDRRAPPRGGSAAVPLSTTPLGMLSRLLHPLAAAAGGASGRGGGAVTTATAVNTATSAMATAATAACAATSGGTFRGTLTIMSLEHVPMEAATLVVEAAVSPPRASVGPSGGVTAVATVARHAAVWGETFPLAVRLPPASRAVVRHDRPPGGAGSGGTMSRPVLRLAVRRAGGVAGGVCKRGSAGGISCNTTEAADLGFVELDLEELAHSGGDAATSPTTPPATPGVATINRKFLLLRSSINATLRVAVSLALVPVPTRRWGRRPTREPPAALPTPRSAIAAATTLRSSPADAHPAANEGAVALPALWLPPSAHAAAAGPAAAAALVAPPRNPARNIGSHRRVRSLNTHPLTYDSLTERRPRTRKTTPAGSAAPSVGSSDTDREVYVCGLDTSARSAASPPVPSAAAVAAAASARRRHARTKGLTSMAAGAGGVGYSAFQPGTALLKASVPASDPGLSPSPSSVDAPSLAYLSTTSSSCGSGGVAAATSDGADTLSAALGLGRGETAGVFDIGSARGGSGSARGHGGGSRGGSDGRCHLPQAVAASRVDAAETVAAVVATGVAKAAARKGAGDVGEWEWLAAMQERVSDAFEEERMVMSRSPYGQGGAERRRGVEEGRGRGPPREDHPALVVGAGD